MTSQRNTISLEQLETLIKRMKAIGANTIFFDCDVNCDTASVESISFDAQDNDLYLETLLTIE